MQERTTRTSIAAGDLASYAILPPFNPTAESHDPHEHLGSVCFEVCLPSRRRQLHAVSAEAIWRFYQFFLCEINNYQALCSKIASLKAHCV